MKRLSRSRLITAALLAATGCVVVGPDHQTPEAKVAPAWREETGKALAARPAELATWWRSFSDPVLDGLVERAARQSLDVRAALLRVREARALRGAAKSELFPTVDGVGTYRRYGESDNTPLGGFVPDSDLWAMGFDAAWEIDLWGRVRRSIEAADAELLASIEDTRDVAVTVEAETAASYVELRAFEKRLAIARTNLALQEQTLALAQSRLDSGLVGERDVAQAKTNVATTRSRLPALEVGVRTAENRLAVLLGLPPGSLAEDLAPARPIPVPPVEVAVGVPADLLRRRPDVRRAERLLAAETARIGVAEGDLYPRLSILGSLGVSAEDASDVFDSGSSFFGIGPSLRWNLFDAGGRRRRVEAQESRAEQARLAWESSVLLALEEAENAMTGFVREQVRRRSLVEGAEQARRAVELAQTQYREGLSDFQVVLDSERVLADLEDDLAVSDAAVATRLVALYKALGGGWESDETMAARAR